MERPLRSLKGVGEKTEKLFQKIGVSTTEELLRYYPRNYEAYEAPVPVEELKEGCIASVQATIVSGVYINKVRNLQVITITAADATEKIGIAWFNMPYLKNMLKKGSVFIFRGRVVRKQGKLQMEHPEIFTPAAYGEILHSLQPVYALTAGLSNKTIGKLVRQAIKEQTLQMEYLPEEVKER